MSAGDRPGREWLDYSERKAAGVTTIKVTRATRALLEELRDRAYFPSWSFDELLYTLARRDLEAIAARQRAGGPVVYRDAGDRPVYRDPLRDTERPR